MKHIVSCWLIIGMIFTIAGTARADDKVPGSYQTKTEQLKREIKENPGNWEAMFRLGVIYHDMANLYHQPTARSAVKMFKEAYKIKNLPLIKAYQGSALTLIARDAVNPLIKLDTVSRGIKLIDEAVREAPDNLTIRMLRAQNSYALPEMFKRRKLAVKDLEYMLGVYKKDPERVRKLFDPALIFYYRGMIYKNNGRMRLAQRCAELAVKIAVNPRVRQLSLNFMKLFQE
ncbi:MAG: hypothetical protein GXP33_11295 [Spirochaetes bacterium]|nr:hypothetical protein [Spirochaetota bacterium]